MGESPSLSRRVPDYVWQHDLQGERARLRLMSDLLDPASRFHLLRIGVTTGWRCLDLQTGKFDVPADFAASNATAIAAERD